MSEAKAQAPEGDNYRRDLCETVIALGKDGFSRAEIASHLKILRSTLDQWIGAHDEFAVAMTRARDEELAWWERRARLGLEQGAKINTTLWSRCMTARFPGEAYSERGAAPVDKDGPQSAMTARDRAKAVAALLAKAR